LIPETVAVQRSQQDHPPTAERTIERVGLFGCCAGTWYPRSYNVNLVNPVRRQHSQSCQHRPVNRHRPVAVLSLRQKILESFENWGATGESS